MINQTKTHLYERTCPQCGKTFCCPSKKTWAYKRFFHGKDNVLCSWTCLQAFNAVNIEKRGKRVSIS